MKVHHLCLTLPDLGDPTSRRRATMVMSSRWPVVAGRQFIIRIGFMSGSKFLRDATRSIAEEWLTRSGVVNNLGFQWTNDVARAEVRIRFDASGGSWSYLGTDATGVSASEPTMNFGWLTDSSEEDEIRRVVLHEFGHMLGLAHEHQNPANSIDWDKEAVYRDYERRGWSRAQIDTNLFAAYDEANVANTKFDPKSIMLYPIPPHHTRDGFSVGLNTDLSDLDLKLIRDQYGS